MFYVLSFQSVHANGSATESKPAVKRSQKPGKKPGAKSGKEGSKKSHNATGETAFHNNSKIQAAIDKVLAYARRKLVSQLSLHAHEVKL